MRFTKLSSILILALVSNVLPLTAFAAADPFESKPSIILLGEDHDDPTQNRLFEWIVNDLANRGVIDTIGTELVPETLNADFQVYLNGQTEDDRTFFSKMKVHPVFRPNLEAKLISIFRLNKINGGRLKFCGIEAKAVEHLSDDPKMQLSLVQARLKLVSPEVVASASKTFGLDIRSIQNPTSNADRETKMASNVLECLKGRRSILVHVGNGHAYRETRSTIPGWRTLTDIIEDFLKPSKAVTVFMTNVSSPQLRDIPEFRELHLPTFLSVTTISESGRLLLGKRFQQIDFILPTRDLFERQ
jgi:hypothetical protein